ncbi:MAG: DapH/DapD/GlmU-related protein [Pseudomonadota bacterium]
MTRPKTFRQRFQQVLRRKLWRMDIADSAWIAETASLDRNWPQGIHVGEGSTIADWAIVLSHDHTRGLYSGTVVGARTIIGARAIIMPGVVVGDDCYVEPGAVVTRDVAPGSRVSGNPARVHKAHTPD